MQQQRGAGIDPNLRRDLESLLALGSAIAWGALAVSVWNFVEFSRARKLRRQISDRLLTQVFPSGRVEP